MHDGRSGHRIVGAKFLFAGCKGALAKLAAFARHIHLDIHVGQIVNGIEILHAVGPEGFGDFEALFRRRDRLLIAARLFQFAELLLERGDLCLVG